VLRGVVISTTRVSAVVLNQRPFIGAGLGATWAWPRVLAEHFSIYGFDDRAIDEAAILVLGKEIRWQ